jgi:hypothetical protein
MEQFETRNLPKALIEPTDNSVILTLVSFEGKELQKLTFNKISEASRHYDMVCKKIINNAEKTKEKKSESTELKLKESDDFEEKYEDD